MALTAEKTALGKRMRDRDEELRGKAKLLEVCLLQCELHQRRPSMHPPAPPVSRVKWLTERLGHPRRAGSADAAAERQRGAEREVAGGEQGACRSVDGTDGAGGGGNEYCFEIFLISSSIVSYLNLTYLSIISYAM